MIMIYTKIDSRLHSLDNCIAWVMIDLVPVLLWCVGTVTSTNELMISSRSLQDSRSGVGRYSSSRSALTVYRRCGLNL